MSGKLLHERLREHAADDRYDFWCGDTEIVSLWADEALALADEIERQYVPVPRFPDGEPVREGSETRYGTVSYIDVEVSDTCWGNWIIHTDDDNCIEGTLSQRVERPAPKVLDADGNPLETGRNRWSIRTGEQVVVNQVRADFCLCTVLGDGCTHGTIGIEPSGLTSREPDSLEKAMERFQSILEDHDGLEPETEDELRKVHIRLTALIERGA